MNPERSRDAPRRNAPSILAAKLAAMLVVPLAAACSPLAPLNYLVSTHGLEVTRGEAYGPGLRHRLDVYAPEEAVRDSAKGAPEAAPRTVVVFFYGGGWRIGDRADYRFVARALADAGHVVVIPDYRLHPEVRFPAFVEDGASALAWVRGNIGAHGGDPDRIVLMGHSAGAHLALMLALAPDYLDAAGVPREAIRAAVGIAGPYAFDPHDLGHRRAIFTGHDPIEEILPLTFARRAAASAGPALLLMHGTADRTVGHENSVRLAEAYRAAGGDARVVSYDGVGHIGILLTIAGGLFRGPPVMEDSVAFIREVVPGTK